MHLGQCLDQLHLVGRQIHVRTVEALRFVVGRQAQEDDDWSASPRPARPPPEPAGVVTLGGAHAEPGGEIDLHLVADTGPQLVERHVELGRVDLRAARPW